VTRLDHLSHLFMLSRIDRCLFMVMRNRSDPPGSAPLSGMRSESATRTVCAVCPRRQNSHPSFPHANAPGLKL
jgi:hypothetical protein